MIIAFYSFFINNSHTIKIIMCQVQMLSSFVFHLFALKVDWQLFDLEAILITDVMGKTASELFARVWTTSASLYPSLVLMIVRKRYFGVTLIRRYFSTAVIHVESIYVLRMVCTRQKLLLPLSGVYNPSSLHFSFLTGASSPTGNSLTIIMGLRIEIISCSRERR